MANYIFAYHGKPDIKTKEDGQKMMTEWRAWMLGLGDAIVDNGAPVGMSKTINSDGSISDDGGSNPLMGYTVIKADSIEAAIELAKPCPHVTYGGSIEVAEAMNMEM